MVTGGRKRHEIVNREVTVIRVFSKNFWSRVTRQREIIAKDFKIKDNCKIGFTSQSFYKVP